MIFAIQLKILQNLVLSLLNHNQQKTMRPILSTTNMSPFRWQKQKNILSLSKSLIKIKISNKRWKQNCAKILFILEFVGLVARYYNYFIKFYIVISSVLLRMDTMNFNQKLIFHLIIKPSHVNHFLVQDIANMVLKYFFNL